jgi:uncharacterized protein
LKLHLDRSDVRYRITAYREGQVTVNEEVLTRSFVLGADQLLRDWAPASVGELGAAHLAPLAAFEPELVIIGSGRRQEIPAPDVLAPLLSAGIGVEVMDTGAACRTYSVLAGEGRRVALAVLLPGS